MREQGCGLREKPLSAALGLGWPVGRRQNSQSSTVRSQNSAPHLQPPTERERGGRWGDSTVCVQTPHQGLGGLPVTSWDSSHISLVCRWGRHAPRERGEQAEGVSRLSGVENPSHPGTMDLPLGIWMGRGAGVSVSRRTWADWKGRRCRDPGKRMLPALKEEEEPPNLSPDSWSPCLLSGTFPEVLWPPSW